jgi:DNA-binding CsgD family transcriptional regulator
LSRTLIIGRDPRLLTPIIERLGGERACMIFPAIEEVRRRGDLSRLRTAVIVLEAPAADAPVGVARAARALLPEARMVLLSCWPLPPVDLFGLMIEAVDLAVAREPGTFPEHVAALLEGRAPRVADLLGFCQSQRLSPTETRAFLAACAGLSKAEAHEHVGCSIRTLESHWSRIFGKVGIRCTDGVLAAALRYLLLGDPDRVQLTQHERRGAPLRRAH